MAATNQSEAQGGKTFYKLKEDERDAKSKGELRFFKQEKQSDKWMDGETFDTLSGEVVKVEVKEYEFQGEKKKALVIGLQDGIDKFEFTLGLRSFTAQGILNTLAGNNPKQLYFVCGRPKENNGKSYPTLYINKDGATNEERRTTWKYAPAELPKVTTEIYKGNKIKIGQEEADTFWVGVVSEVQQKMKGAASTGAQGLKNNTPFETEKSQATTSAPDDDLPF